MVRYVKNLHIKFYCKNYVVSNVVSSHILCFIFYAIIKSSYEFGTLLVMQNLCTFNCFNVHVLIFMTHKLTHKHDAYMLTNLAWICNLRLHIGKV
jgi:hypothetical protein